MLDLTKCCQTHRNRTSTFTFKITLKLSLRILSRLSQRNLLPKNLAKWPRAKLSKRFHLLRNHWLLKQLRPRALPKPLSKPLWRLLPNLLREPPWCQSPPKSSLADRASLQPLLSSSLPELWARDSLWDLFPSGLLLHIQRARDSHFYPLTHSKGSSNNKRKVSFPHFWICLAIDQNWIW